MQQQKKYNRIITKAGILLCLGIVIILAYKSNVILISKNAIEAEGVDKIKVGIITSDVIHDQSWGGLAYEGQLRINERFPIDSQLISEKQTKEEMIEGTLELISKKPEIIIGHGREFSELFTELAPDHKEIHFVTIHGTSDHPNQSVFTYEDFTEGYYAAGMIAGLMSKTKKIALIVPFDPDEETVKTFVRSVEELDLDIEHMIRIVGSRDDEENAKIITKELIELGVDVIFTRGNRYNRVVIDEVRKAGIYAIGFIDNQSYMAKDHVLTSLMNDIPQTYVKIMDQFFDHEGLQPGTTTLSYKDEVFRLAPFGPMVPEAIRNKVSEAIELFHEGEATN